MNDEGRAIVEAAQAEYARRGFYNYCQMMFPKFYTKERWHLKKLCDALENFYFNSDKIYMVCNTGPRLGKSFTIQNFCDYLYKNPELQIMIGTYNEKLSTRFAKMVRNTINTQKTETGGLVYHDIFPNTRIKRGSAAANLWSLQGSNDNFLATSPTGTSTGFGAQLVIVDDLVKDAKEAMNPAVLEGHWDWFQNTIKSRVEQGGKIIIIATMWSSEDLSNRILEEYGEDKVEHLVMPACLNEEKHEMLCPSLLSWESYEEKISHMDRNIASANYQQVCLDSDNKLFKNMKTYKLRDLTEEYYVPGVSRETDRRKKHLEIYSYCDSADEGNDFLCNIIFGWDISTRRCFILDVYYTTDSMETTELEVAKRLDRFGVQNARIESNNGGRGFARNVRRNLEEKFNNYRCSVTWFYNSSNKLSRIRSNSSQVCEFCFFCNDWYLRFPDFFRDLNRFKSDGNNTHDDSADALTGVIETIILTGGI